MAKIPKKCVGSTTFADGGDPGYGDGALHAAAKDRRRQWLREPHLRAGGRDHLALDGGLFLGIFSAVSGVLLVNYVFTYPYWEFNFTITGYPFTFLAMLTVSMMISAMNTQIKSRSGCASKQKRKPCAPISCARCRTISARR